MDSYNFTYRRIQGKCFHCKKLDKRSKFKKLFDGIFRSKKLAEEASKECQLEWKSIEVGGHGLERIGENHVNEHRMVLYLKDGSIMTIIDWSACELKLGTDWVLFTKRQMEKESGQDAKLNV